MATNYNDWAQPWLNVDTEFGGYQPSVGQLQTMARQYANQNINDPTEYLQFIIDSGGVNNLQQAIYGHGSNVGSLLPHEELVQNSLKEIATQAGLPANFDWTPHLANVAMQINKGSVARQHGAQGGFDIGRDNSAMLVEGAVKSAMQQYPQLQQALPLVQQGGPLWQQAEDLRNNYWEWGKTRKKESFKKWALMTAAAFGGGYLAYGAGGAGAAGAGSTAGGWTAAEEAAMLTGSGGAGGGSLGGTFGAAAGAGSGIDWSTATADSGTTMTDASIIDGEAMYDGSGLSGELSAGAPQGGGMQPGWGGYGETGEFGWEGDIPGGPGVTNTGGNMSLMDVIKKFTGVGTQSGATGDYEFPWENVLGGLIGQYFNRENSKDLAAAMDRATAAADPFAAQRPQYQQQFSQLTSNPSNFFQDPAIKSIMDQGQETSARKMASMGYNMSGNMAQELTKTAQNTAFGQYMPYANMIGQAAGAQTGPGNAGTVAMGGANANQAAQNQQTADWMKVLGDIFAGQQPSSAQQVPRTNQQNFGFAR